MHLRLKRVEFSYLLSTGVKYYYYVIDIFHIILVLMPVRRKITSLESWFGKRRIQVLGEGVEVLH